VVLLATCTALLALNYALLYQNLYRNPHAPAPADMARLAREDPPNTKAQSYLADNAASNRLRNQALLSSAETSAIALAVTALFGFGVCWIVAGRTLRPLRTLTAATRRVSHEHLNERVALSGPDDELKELADTFDDMVGRLESSFASQRRFVADAAHELRTPLSIVRTGAEVQLAKPNSTPDQWQAMARRVLIATGRAERLLDGLLALARSDSGAIAYEAHDLAVAVATALAEADDEAEQADLTVRADLRPASVHGDPVLLDRLVRNLVDNAIRHNRPAGTVEVVTAQDDGDAVVTVQNTGQVVPPGEVGRLFEPFQRLAPSRTGSTGLGLAIVRSIVRAHGGQVTAVANEHGGLTVTVRLLAVRAP